MSESAIRRQAIDENGKIGRLYEIFSDSMLIEEQNIGKQSVVSIFDKITCEIVDGNKPESHDLLKWVKMEDDLRLNILLNPELRTGIGELAYHYHPNDQYIRIMRIYYPDRQWQLTSDSTKDKKHEGLKIRDANATHIITAVSLGIDVIIVLELPNKDKLASQIDVILGKILARWKNPDAISTFTPEDTNLLSKINVIKVYSNVPTLREKTSLVEICLFIDGHTSDKDRRTWWPLEYNLELLKSSPTCANTLLVSSLTLDENSMKKLETYLLGIFQYRNKVTHYFKNNKSANFSVDISKFFTESENEWQKLHEIFEKKISEIRTLVLQIRKGNDHASKIEQIINNKEHKLFRDEIREFAHRIADIDFHMKSISSKEKQQSMMQNLFDSTEGSTGNGHKTSKTHIIQGSIDSANNSNHSENRKKNQLSPISPPTVDSSKNEPIPSSPLDATNVTESPRIPKPTEIINILLLGESGVGKSTFINALVNYLMFGSLDKAEKGRPVVLIPVSFLLTTGDNFEEHNVKFGDSDSFNNENFDHPGQSVTQHCKSYIFQLNRSDGNKIRIIDTPGFGDTRGLHQDDVNMQHILEYINHLTHLNAVCFLLKPNASRVHSFFKTCLTQLIDFLDANVRQNIVFCFTNARSTFYTPGDTVPILKAVLKSSGYEDVPFKKENTFCFDNESFRYLVARQNGIKFSDGEHTEYQNSWVTSVKESQNFLDYVSKNLVAHRIVSERQSIISVQFHIKCMIRPILEALRNTLRNLTVWEMDSPNKSIELHAECLDRPASFCVKCKSDVIERGHFLIARYVPHEIEKTCKKCTCSIDEHNPMNYKLDFKYTDRSLNDNRAYIQNNIENMLRASAVFAYFLMNIANTTKDDTFWMGFVQMICEENDFSQSNNSFVHNKQLGEELRKSMMKYEQYFGSIKSSDDAIKLRNISESIQKMHEIPAIRIQMDAVRRSREMIMKKYESEYPVS